MATELERCHEHTHGILFIFGEAVLVIMQHLIQVQRQLGSMLREGEHRLKSYLWKQALCS